MTMYLPNPDVRPTGYEAGEFLDLPPMGDGANHPPSVGAGTSDPSDEVSVTSAPLGDESMEEDRGRGSSDAV